jgi:hypothetical protein
MNVMSEIKRAIPERITPLFIDDCMTTEVGLFTVDNRNDMPATTIKVMATARPKICHMIGGKSKPAYQKILRRI